MYYTRHNFAYQDKIMDLIKNNKMAFLFVISALAAAVETYFKFELGMIVCSSILFALSVIKTTTILIKKDKCFEIRIFVVMTLYLPALMLLILIVLGHLGYISINGTFYGFLKSFFVGFVKFANPTVEFYVFLSILLYIVITWLLNTVLPKCKMPNIKYGVIYYIAIALISKPILLFTAIIISIGFYGRFFTNVTSAKNLLEPLIFYYFTFSAVAWFVPYFFDIIEDDYSN
jgi:hypothetical protein